MTQPQEPRGATSAHLSTEELSECAYSPETAAPDRLGHLRGCLECAAGIEDLRFALAKLAALPEPPLPESVAIRLDATIARAFQQQDAEQTAADPAAGRSAGHRARFSWRRLALPVGALGLLAAAGVGVADLVGSSGGAVTNAAGASNNGPHAAAPDKATQSGPNSAAGGVAPDRASGVTNSAQSALAEWAQSVVGSGTNTAPGFSSSNPQSPAAQCAEPPARSGYTTLTTAHEQYAGSPVTLVVYQNATEPASSAYLAVVYAGSCADASEAILYQGAVSR